jgi:RNA recognition motif-containing protein
VRQAFEDVGRVLDIRMHEEKSFAFVLFSNHDEATKAIVEKNNMLIGSRRVNVKWSKMGETLVATVGFASPLTASPAGDAHPPPGVVPPQRSW